MVCVNWTSQAFFRLLPQSGQDAGSWWFCSFAFSRSTCWSHDHLMRLYGNVSISREVGQLVGHSKKFFGKFHLHRIRKKKYICMHTSSSDSVLRTTNLGKLNFSFHGFVRVGSHNFPPSWEATRLDWSRVSHFLVPGTFFFFSWFFSFPCSERYCLLDYLLNSNQFSFLPSMIQIQKYFWLYNEITFKEFFWCLW